MAKKKKSAGKKKAAKKKQPQPGKPREYYLPEKPPRPKR